MSCDLKLQTEPSSPSKEMMATKLGAHNRIEDLIVNRPDNVFCGGEEGTLMRDDIENMDRFGGFDEASMKMKDGLTEVLSRLNKRFDRITNDMIRNYLKEMTSETEKEILADSKIQRDIAEKIHQLELAFDEALFIDGLKEPVQEVDTSDETSGDLGDDLFESVDDTSDIEDDDITNCSNFSTDVDTQEEFIEFEDATEFEQEKFRETLPAPPAIPGPVAEAQKPQSLPKDSDLQRPREATFSRIVSPDGSSLSNRFPPLFSENRIVDPSTNYSYRVPLDPSATQYLGYQAPAPYLPCGAQMPYFRYPTYFSPIAYPCFCPPRGPQRYPTKYN